MAVTATDGGIELGGVLQPVTVLFADIRGFTGLAEGRLPYDVVFVLNRYFGAMGRAVAYSSGCDQARSLSGCSPKGCRSAGRPFPST